MKEKLSAVFRPPLKSDNLNETMRLNRFIAKPLVIPVYLILFDIVLICLFSAVVNIIHTLPQMIHGEDADLISLGMFLPHFGRYGSLIRASYIIFFIVLIIIDLVQAYKIRVSWGETDINKGNSGTRRWTTIEEIKRQYHEIDLYPSTIKEVPIDDGDSLSEDVQPDGSYLDEIIYDDCGRPVKKRIKSPNFYDGKGGLPVSRWRDRLYIDTQLTNNLILGTTRSGKGEMFVFPEIDILSRARDIKNRPSLIVFDPKVELYKSAKKTLEKRGYLVRLINLDNPMKSAGYNPLEIVSELYAQGKQDDAKQLAKSFAFSIFQSSKDMSEPIWKNTATDLFTALIIAVVSDCIDADEELNSKRRDRMVRLQEAWDDIEDKEEAEEVYKKIGQSLKPGADLLSIDYMDQIRALPPDYTFQPVYPNRQKANCFSVINFFKELCDVTADFSDEPKGHEKKAETALDEYFNQRPPLDYAKSLYASIKEAGDRTKGSIFVNMQSALGIFSLDSIARMTAESDIEFAEIGFGEKPVAVFLGLPTEDKSNHFIAVNFVTQLFQYLFRLAKAESGTLKRNVRFILDEFGNMPVIDDFGSKVTNCLGVGFSFDIFIQSYGQLKASYEMDIDTIKDNFANQVYILAQGTESAEEFSTQLGKKTVIELQRTGTRFGKSKTFMENSKERPLLFPQELQDFREGECAVIRGSHRTDKAGAGIKSYPILMEYQDHLTKRMIRGIKRYVKKSRRENGAAHDRMTGHELTYREELAAAISKERWYQGTALMYRYQYATSDFPNPTDIPFDSVCTESRQGIDYTKRVVDPGRVVKILSGEDPDELPNLIKKKTIGELKGYYKLDNMLAIRLGNDYKSVYGFSVDTSLDAAIEILDDLRGPQGIDDEFIGTVKSIIIRD